MLFLAMFSIFLGSLVEAGHFKDAMINQYHQNTDSVQTSEQKEVIDSIRGNQIRTVNENLFYKDMMKMCEVTKEFPETCYSDLFSSDYFWS